MQFKIEHKDSASKARAGIIETGRGLIKTPVFMPVGTVGTVKTVQQFDLVNELNSDIILGNTYHLYLRPGLDILNEAGGLHKFINWDRPILTDSGGYQVYSLSSRRKITEEGATFSSHIDGSKHTFTPENVIDIQRRIGADIIMAFDECPPFPSTEKYTRESMHLTHRWLDRCLLQMKKTKPEYGIDQTLAPIVQGGSFRSLRHQSAEWIASKNCELNAIGGLSVGEPAEVMYEMTELCCSILQEDKPRYLMGVGTPDNLLECIGLGIDMFDCVLPTRNARHGLLYTWEGVINIKNAKWKNDFSLIDNEGEVLVDTYYTKAYLRHLYQAKEYLGPQIASLHNLGFYMRLMRKAREKISSGEFRTWKDSIIPKIQRRL